MRNFLLALFVLALLGSAIFVLNRDQARPVEDRFEQLAEIDVDGNAEIIVARPDGNILVFTNAMRRSIDTMDISDPAAPRPAGRIALPGEPTSVALSPDGRWALAVVHLGAADEAADTANPMLPGGLAIIDLADPEAPALAELIGIGHQPDSIAVAASGADLVAVIAIENEPVPQGDDGRDGSRPGQIQVVTINPARLGSYRVGSLDISEARLREAGLEAPADAQPEFVALSPDRSLAAVSLQENNGIVVFDPYWLETRRMFSSGIVTDRPADLQNDGQVAFTQQYPADAGSQPLAGSRMPDGLAFSPDGRYLYSADEGDGALTGGRGISAWTIDGEFVWDDGGEIERAAAAAGLYPDHRSESRGIEIEGIVTARFGATDYAFALSERGSFMAVYDITTPTAPQLLQLLPTGKGPESAVVLPGEMLAVAAEKSGTVTLYRHSVTN